MLAELRQPSREYYVAVLNDRASQGVVLVASNQGGMNIEDVAAKDPSAIITTPIPFSTGLTKEAAIGVAKKLGFSSEKATNEAADIFINLYRIFKEKDATQIEINPLAETTDGAVLWSVTHSRVSILSDCFVLFRSMDAKFGFDDNAEFRQKDIFDLRDISQEEPSEVEAQKANLNFIKLDGNIGCLVNGAGLAMATMDVLSLHGGQPANFLDVGGYAPSIPISGSIHTGFQRCHTRNGQEGIRDPSCGSQSEEYIYQYLWWHHALRLYRRRRHQGNQRTFLDSSLSRPSQGHKGSRSERVNSSFILNQDRFLC